MYNGGALFVVVCFDWCLAPLTGCNRGASFLIKVLSDALFNKSLLVGYFLQLLQDVGICFDVQLQNNLLCVGGLVFGLCCVPCALFVIALNFCFAFSY